MSNNSHIDIAVASIGCFTDDGTLSKQEVSYLLNLALRDSVVDDEEKRVLKNIFSKVKESDVSKETWALMQEARSKHNF